ncbi:hypothetical protein [Naumannella cuiyingiana]|uniref:hypothetical protein n=1 Tax=Naumannella cuiyingiana TaxID=1347891 RepID=UPI001FE2F603|nr:hypothetical protein [Naumannella cuiyingiana]
MVVFDAAVDVGQARPDAVLVAFQCGEVDRVGEVSGEELVGLVFQAAAVRCKLGQLVGSGREPFVESLLDLGDRSGVWLRCGGIEEAGPWSTWSWREAVAGHCVASHG